MEDLVNLTDGRILIDCDAVKTAEVIARHIEDRRKKSEHLAEF